MEPVGASAPFDSGRRSRGPKPRRLTQILTLSLLSVLLIVAMSVAYVLRDLQSSIDVIDESALGERPFQPAKGAVNILVMGSDTREGANNIDGNDSIGQRSDTTILLHLAEDRKHVYGISIPRDTMIDRPDCNLADGEVAAGESYVMWNDAFNVGGPLCTVQQFEAITGIYVDHFVVVEFSGFKNMVDALGGVEVCLAEPISDSDDGRDIYLPAGPQVVSGDDALNFVRVRNVGTGSDIDRIKRQQAFVASMAKQVLSSDTLASPVKAYRFLKAALQSVKVSKGLSDLRSIAGLGYEFREIDFKKVQFITVPIKPDPANPDRLVFKNKRAEKLFDRLRNDKSLNKKLRSTAIKSANPHNGDANNKGGKNDAATAEAARAGLCT